MPFVYCICLPTQFTDDKLNQYVGLDSVDIFTGRLCSQAALASYFYSPHCSYKHIER